DLQAQESERKQAVQKRIEGKKQRRERNHRLFLAAGLLIEAGLIGERISQDFQRLEESVANMKANADALNRDIATIHSNIVQ
ncbi:hypothetical protein ACSLNR_29735, partial [Escherichia coli]